MTVETPELYLLRRGDRIAALARIAGPFRGFLTRQAALIFRHLDDVKRMREMLDAIAADLVGAEFPDFDPPLGCEHAVALAELQCVVQRWRPL